MARVIPNENSWVGFATTVAGADLVPTAAEVAGAVPITHELVSINASSQGNVVPTPALDSLFETNVIGTSQATFSMDLYREDDQADPVYAAFVRGAAGFIIISRFGGTGANGLPVATDVVEVWPIKVVSRANSNMANNTVMTYTVTCSVPVEPNEAATIAA